MIGISTACFFPLETEQTLDLISEAGFQTMEVFLQAEREYHLDYLKKLKERADDLGISVNSVHSFCRPFEPYLFSNYPRRAQDSYDVFEKVVRAAHVLGAPYYTFHGNIESETTDAFDYRRFAAQMERLCLRCREDDVYLAWENVAWCQSKDPQFIRRTLEYLDPSILCFTLDLKQARRAGVDFREYLAVMKNRLATVHINDADEKHTCLLPGFGKTDFCSVDQALTAAGFQGNHMIEVYRSDFQEMEEVAYSKQYLESIF